MKVSTRERISLYPYEFYILYKSIGGNLPEQKILKMVDRIEEDFNVYIDMVKSNRLYKANSIEGMKHSKDFYKFSEIELVYQDKPIAIISSDDKVLFNVIDLKLCNDLKFNINELDKAIEEKKNSF